MIVGEREQFAVEFEVVTPIDQRWVYGRFCFWAQNQMVGDNLDDSVDLRSCVNWLRDFIEVKQTRYEPGLFELSAREVFRLLTEGVLVFFTPDEGVGEYYPNSLSRFHVSHLGMSAFDRTTIVLIENEIGEQRLVWTSPEETILDAILPPGLMQRVVSEAITCMEEEFSKQIASLDKGGSPR